MFLLNVRLTTLDGEAISLPWLRAALTLSRVSIRRSAVLTPVWIGAAVFTAELRAPLDASSLERIAASLKLAYVSYYDSEIGGRCIGEALNAPLVPERFVMLSGASLHDVLSVVEKAEELERERAQGRQPNKKLACGCEMMPLTGALLGESALVLRCPGHAQFTPSPWTTPLEQGDQS